MANSIPNWKVQRAAAKAYCASRNANSVSLDELRAWFKTLSQAQRAKIIADAM